MDIPEEVIRAADSVLAEVWVAEMAEVTEGRVCTVDGDNYLELLNRAEVLARWVKKLQEG